ncbi:hypothetical protein KP509_26G043700 [Ceratopteris richardii]|uniref:Isopenicillin N synthase-like Fe(2+) 2OG dioxygenase domain-containing protein n=1 Tax=Ceratopteris richardii TaxID=49495 RepID=A0A8T2RM55_CERRI|nr:hypothetical protein KP509_26G043700 [Ceratopteris richardii]KAH7296894.1 hypothetical protein KP509_26G043700 [Ceratopteris richardii]
MGRFRDYQPWMSVALQNQLKNAAHQFFSLPTEVQVELVQTDPSSPLSVFTGLRNEGECRNRKRTLGFKPNPSVDVKLLPCLLRWNYKGDFRWLATECRSFFQHHTRRQTMAVNYYPPCTETKFSYGLRPHSDLGSIRIVMQDEVKGLQIRRSERASDRRNSQKGCIRCHDRRSNRGALSCP